jgi:site-specific recombinase XerD
MTISNALELYILDCRSRNLSPRTIKFYREKGARLIGALGDRDIGGVTTVELRQFIGTISVRSMPRYFQVVRTIFGFAHREELIAVDPSRKLKRPKVDEIEIQPLTSEQIKKLYHIAGHTGRNRKRDAAIFALLVGTGIRSGELLNLRREDISTDGIMVNGKGRHRRYIPLRANVGLLLMKYDAVTPPPTDGKFFRGKNGKGLNENELRAVFWRLVDRSGIKVWPHLLRHTFASSFMSRDGADVLKLQRICGWKTLSMAQRYAHLSQEAIRSAMNEYSPADLL